MVMPIVFAAFGAKAFWHTMTMSAHGLAHVTAAVANPSIAAYIAPDLYDLQMNAYRHRPNVPPSAETILQAYNRGWITQGMTATVLRNQGINWGMEVHSARMDNHGRAWEAARQMMVVRPTVDGIMGLWSRGYWGPNSQIAKDAVKRAGGDPDEWHRLLPAHFNVPSVGEILVGWNRELVNEQQVDEMLKKNGYGFKSHRELLKQMRFQVPGPSDLIRFAVKEAFSPVIASALQMYDEFPDAIQPYMRMQGLDWDTEMVIQADGKQRVANVMDLYWASHWQPLSPGQAFQAYHLLRPERIARYQARGLNVEPFTIDNVRQWLQIDDYPPSVRDTLLAMSFSPLRLYDIRRGLMLGYVARNEPSALTRYGADLTARLATLNRRWAIDQYRDRGVHPDDAASQADMAIAAAADQRFAPIRNLERQAPVKLVRAIIKGYSLGVLSDVDAKAMMVELGMNIAAAETHLRVANAEVDMATTHEILKAMRRNYLMGGMTDTELLGALLRAGVSSAMQDTYAARWKAEKNYSRRVASTAQLQKWVANGWITVADATQRLKNIGWTNPDIAVLLESARADAIKMIGRAQRTAFFDVRRAAADLQKVQNELNRQFEKNQATMRRITPRSQLERWLRKGMISGDTFIARMVAMGFSRKSAELYLKDATTCPKCAMCPAGKCPAHGGPADGKTPASTPALPPGHPSHVKKPEGPVDTTVKKVDTKLP